MTVILLLQRWLAKYLVSSNRLGKTVSRASVSHVVHITWLLTPIVGPLRYVTHDSVAHLRPHELRQAISAPRYASNCCNGRNQMAERVATRLASMQFARPILFTLISKRKEEILTTAT